MQKINPFSLPKSTKSINLKQQTQLLGQLLLLAMPLEGKPTYLEKKNKKKTNEPF